MSTVLLAPSGAGTSRRRLALLLQAKLRLAEAVSATGRLLRRAYGFGADLICQLPLSGSLRAVAAAAGSVIHQGLKIGHGLRLPALAASVLLSSAAVRERASRLLLQVRLVATVTARLVAGKVRRSIASTGPVVRGLSRAVTGILSMAGKLFGGLRRKAAAVVKPLQRLVSSRALLPVSLLCATVLHPVALPLAIVAGALALKRRIPNASPATASAAVSTSRPAEDLHEPSERLSNAEIVSIYEAMLTLETALPAAKEVVKQALSNADEQGRTKAADLLVHCRAEAIHLAELRGELCRPGISGSKPTKAELDLAADIDELFQRIEPQLEILELELIQPGDDEPFIPAPANRAQRRAASSGRQREGVSTSNGVHP